MLYIQYIQGNCNPQQVVQGSGPDFRLERNPMNAAKKIFPIVAIVCSALALIGWIVFVGGYGYTTTQINQM